MLAAALRTIKVTSSTTGSFCSGQSCRRRARPVKQIPYHAIPISTQTQFGGDHDGWFSPLNCPIGSRPAHSPSNPAAATQISPARSQGFTQASPRAYTSPTFPPSPGSAHRHRRTPGEGWQRPLGVESGRPGCVASGQPTYCVSRPKLNGPKSGHRRADMSSLAALGCSRIFPRRLARVALSRPLRLRPLPLPASDRGSPSRESSRQSRSAVPSPA